MKKITLMFVLLILTSTSIYSQTNNLEKAENYIESKGEVCLVFTANTEAQVKEISQFLSIGHKVNRETLEIEAYANAETLPQFLAYGLPFVVNQSDNEFYANTSENYNALAWDTTWDQFPTYSQYVAKMNYYATNYPSLCTLETIGTTSTGRELLMLKISDNVSTNEAEPEFMYTSSMHGDELTGYPLMIRLIDYLLTNYGSDTEVNNLVNSTVIYINPLANPDGAYRNVGNNTITNPRRGNANNQDINRNFPDNVAGLHYSAIGGDYEIETFSFMKFEASKDIVLSANFHGGTEVVNYPYDNTTSKHVDHNFYEHISDEYATHCQTNSPSGYMTIEYDYPENPSSPGVTQGAIWYQVYGGRQDYMNFYRHSKEVTIELSDTKFIPGSQLPNHWNYNKQALLDYMKQANYGFQGIVTDESGNPIAAKVSISGHDALNSYVFSNQDLGDYYRLIEGGTYTVTYEAPGYTTQNISVSVTDNTKTVQNVTMIATTTLPVASDVTINENESAALAASGLGTINWYENLNDETPLYSGSNYNTPILTNDTSYFVEDVIAKANVGSTDNTTNGSFFLGGTTDRYLVFDCTEPVKLNKVTVNAQQAGEIEVQLQNSSGAMLDSRVVLIESAGVQQIDLDFILPVGTDLRLASVEMSSNFYLYRNNSGTSYPYNNGSISIKTSNAGTGLYYFFYDWEIEAIKSARKEVIVTVEPTLSTIEANGLSDATVYPNPFKNAIHIKLPSQYNSIGVELYDISGRSILKVNTLNSENGIFNLSGINSIFSGTYFIKISDNETTNTITKRLIKQ